MFRDGGDPALRQARLPLWPRVTPHSSGRDISRSFLIGSTRPGKEAREENRESGQAGSGRRHESGQKQRRSTCTFSAPQIYGDRTCAPAWCKGANLAEMANAGCRCAGSPSRRFCICGTRTAAVYAGERTEMKARPEWRERGLTFGGHHPFGVGALGPKSRCPDMDTSSSGLNDRRLRD